jgi:hypothetical protein
MGAWGPAIFSDDTVADIRSEYRELLEDQVSDTEATQRVIAEYQHLDVDEKHLLWLALAAAQHQVGRLEDDIRDRALQVIDHRIGLELWEEAGTKELAKREAALAKLRGQLTGPQPARKVIRRPWRHVTDLTPGAVLAWTAPTGAVALFRVVRINDHRVAASPVLERLDWNGMKLPSRWRLRRLRPRVRERHLGPPTVDISVVSRFRKKDLDWHDIGLEVVSVLEPRSSDATVQPVFYTAWRSLLTDLQREFGGGVAP